jgi:hypothetical protein
MFCHLRQPDGFAEALLLPTVGGEEKGWENSLGNHLDSDMVTAQTSGVSP